MGMRQQLEERTTMMKRIKKKLKSSAGESLGEVLIALLIAALALTMLASVISSAARIITQSKEKMRLYYSANEELNTRTRNTDESKNYTTAGTGKKITVTVKDGATGIKFLAAGNDVLASYYQNAQISSKNVIAYWIPAS